MNSLKLKSEFIRLLKNAQKFILLLIYKIISELKMNYIIERFMQGNMYNLVL